MTREEFKPLDTGRWPDCWRARARQLAAAGVSAPGVAATITLESGRFCSRQQARALQKPQASAGEKAPWPDQWPRRAVELYRESVSELSIAGIITLESGRPASGRIVGYWLRKAGVKPSGCAYPRRAAG